MRLADRPRRALFTAALALFALGFIAFSDSDFAWSRTTLENLDAARDARPDAGWRTATTPGPLLPPILDVAPIAAMILLAVLAVTRNLPEGHARRAHVALGFAIAGFPLSFAGRWIDPTHEHEGAWGAAQVAFAVAVILALVWASRGARVLGVVGAALLVARPPLIWEASDRFVEATGNTASAYGAELAKLAAHVTGTAGSALIGIALLLAAWQMGGTLRARPMFRELPSDVRTP